MSFQTLYDLYFMEYQGRILVNVHGVFFLPYNESGWEPRAVNLQKDPLKHD